MYQVKQLSILYTVYSHSRGFKSGHALWHTSFLNLSALLQVNSTKVSKRTRRGNLTNLDRFKQNTQEEKDLCHPCPHVVYCK